ncbi:guanine nucleotide exchange factor VAV2-like isoform X3 [Mizuhopecten yessoensis]|uniref:guanine nucleotide exchange factor VAV2-like isoform X3 n=1 Tax=Mizuhopecten yessoensis TaxID=6573 RepID=UPI000B457B97|nr:guanine nucleotide exchange factor VAV2-like isoform X3 [Mizuhopecten yessoensis]
MASEEWQQCANWLIRCKILPEDHRATLPDAEIFDLAQALRDGVLICHLLNNLSPASVDVKDFSPRPQLSQFLCLKNIRTFLQTCKRVFGLRDADLFEPQDLFDVKDFRKVLMTLSRLSKTDTAQSHYSGFPPNHRTHRAPPLPVADDDDEDIYGNLPRMALENDLDDNEEIYDKVYQDDDEEIYEDLCARRHKRGSHPVTSPEQLLPSELPPPVTKLDYCVKEIHDTEKNYVDALTMLVQHFTKPLRDVIPATDRDVIFAHIEKMLEIHTALLVELQQACQVACSVATGSGSKIAEVFIKWKSKLLVYGDYCSNLPKAQEKIDDILKRNDTTVKAQVETCEKRANEGKFKLRDLLHVPMQRVLKYHLLLRELMRQTNKNSEDIRTLEAGLEAMMDLSLYVNEVKRDNETLSLIAEIQNSIGDLQMPAQTSLKDYGRLQKDGELRVRAHTENKTKTRYIFLFDKVMLMCKSKMVDKFLWGETYNYKEAIILATFKVDDSQLPKETPVKRGDKWNTFSLVQKDNRTVYTFGAKTEDMRSRWIEAIKLALENTQPPDHPNFVMHTFEKPTECYVCAKLLRGVFFQGYWNAEKKQGVHKECIGKERERVPPIPPRVVETKESRRLSRVKALCDYIGQPAPGAGRNVLSFRKNMLIDIINCTDPQWWKGKIEIVEGWFPQHLVKEEKLTRKDSYVDVQINENGRVTSPPRPHAQGGEGYVNIEDRGLTTYKWFVGNMQRETAIDRLKGLQNGTFLIRVSENPGRKGELSLSIKYDNQVRHIRVERNAENYFFLADTNFFKSLPDLVEYYQHNSLKDSFPGVDTTLIHPFKSQTGGATGPGPRCLGYAVAVYDYAATATTQLSLSRGDRVAIFSKTGSDKGWWKGEHCGSHKVGYFPLAYVREEEDE